MSDGQAQHLLGRLHRRLLAGGVLTERAYGQPSLLFRLARIRFGSALVLSAPALALCLWYSYVAIVAHVRHNLAAGTAEPLTIELFQLHLHDRLAQDRTRLVMPEPLRKSALPTYNLVLSNDNLDRLGKMLPPEDGRSHYVPAHVEQGRDVHEVEVRYRGSKHWHWNHPQKSWKVRAKSGATMDGRQTFNFINTPDPVPFSEQMILDVGREQGLLTPEYFPFRLALNRAYTGVYFFQSAPDEGLLRKAKRMPASIYSGNEAPINPQTGVSSLWESAKHWKKISALDGRYADDFSELEALIRAVHESSAQGFADFVRHHLDLEQAIVFDALDVVFGGNQHDYHQNHKLYFDPYRARFEPIAWNYRGARHQRYLNRTENPLLLRLKSLPGYLSARNRKVYELLQAACSAQGVRARSQALLDQLEADQIRDPYWDAYKLLPVMGVYYRQMVRPMGRERQALVLQTLLDDYQARERFLLETLQAQEVSATLLPVDDQGLSAPMFAVDVLVGGHSGYAVEAIEPVWPPDCRPDSWELWADSDLSDQLTPDADQQLVGGLGAQDVAQLALRLHPRMRMLDRGAVHPYRGGVRTTPEPTRFRLLGVAGGCRPQRVVLRGKSLVTHQAFQFETTPGAGEPASQPCGKEPFRIAPGYVSPHPWCFEKTRTGQVHLGPGVVQVDDTRVFDVGESVVIAPGTTLRLAKRASLVFLGHVHARGTADAPIRFEPQKNRWGGVVLQGPGTVGSRLSHVYVSRGTRPRWGFVRFPGTLSIHDTMDIEVSHARIEDSQRCDDALHVTYVHDFRLTDSTFHRNAVDGADIEYSTATLERLTFVDTGDEPIDLMGSEVRVSDSRFVKWGGSAISVGEESEVVVQNSVAADGNVGIHLKNASDADVDGLLLYGNQVGARLEYVSQWYSGKTRIRGPVLYAVNCEKTLIETGGTHSRLGRIQEQLGPTDLPHLRTQVLKIADWDALRPAIDALASGGAR